MTPRYAPILLLIGIALLAVGREAHGADRSREAPPARDGSGAVAYTDLSDSQKLLVNGWSVDGLHLVYTSQEVFPNGLMSSTRFTGVISGRAGSENHLDAQAYETWSRQHPESKSNWTIPDSPTDSAKVVVEGDGKWAGHQWKHWSFTGRPGKKLRCVIRREKTVLDLHEFRTPPGTTEADVRVFWAPGGRRIGLLFSGRRDAPPESEASFLAFSELAVDRTIGPRIEITGPAGLQPETFDHAAELIEKAGSFAPTGQRTVSRASAKTIVYALGRYKKDAAIIAAALPGGAAVKPLAAPRNGFEVIVALGASAAAPREQ